jgi:hypothetical protein
VELHPGVEDAHVWRFATNGQFSVKSAYECFFKGSVEFEHYGKVWKTWASAKCRYFIWLVAQQMLDSQPLSKVWNGSPGEVPAL